MDDFKLSLSPHSHYVRFPRFPYKSVSHLMLGTYSQRTFIHKIFSISDREPTLTSQHTCSMRSGGDFWRGMDGSSSSCCCCCSPVRGSYRSALCAYAAGLTSNVEQIPVFNLSSLNFYLFTCLYVHGHRVVIVSCSLWSRPCSVV